ncbi:hypothetical protein ZOSMA_10G01690 [Zostera marina]|uniref:Uncharacterized protein n=1 Tax=Zostera marina TaxID=29655 RepID=A0A0K9Q5T4_ZOSMR|nr:hypothetical protein ZOSMA_10G01690 [Zostera marina]
MVDGLSRDADVNTMNSNRTNSLDFETCFDPEFVLRALFDQIIFVESLDSQPPNWPTTDIVIHFVPGPSPNEVAAEFSDILSHWIWKLCGSSHANANDKSRNQVDMLICKILNEKIPISKGSSDLLNIKGLGSIDPPLLLPPLSYDSSQRKYEQGRRAVVAMLVWLRKVVALDPGGMSQSFDFRDPEELKWQKLVLSTRKALLQMTQNCLDEGDIPKKKKRTTSKTQIENAKIDDELNLGERKSQRVLDLLKSYKRSYQKKRIPIGKFFQADVPKWTGPRIK